ncbi:hypothetical protein TREMEDRAFT_59291 [Tremella mesenterica DSM 1558]|uniref:uncharacterized protein n=1 Tax=Tremella mesenterica (strain ATCC 24925 / CBS 8224 / DSM 1558 / NBRC 9311 / NRRL Y-6157 / RJB 2259-6 / UBC 559-6) TaxID=578456 RepID=UPI0003F4A5FF|nr:uncharacterized protein TREMEDRAFT_59291 [Tremella mesenterica DSM 1558]EIW73129.1 hypothetical protein TREMEDRAFT_59291 [Tremella mesenterica DSM 1558]
MEERNQLSWQKAVEYSGYNFFSDWDFFTGQDPSHGLVNYTDATTAFDDGLAFWTNTGVPGIQVDHWTKLPSGTPRNSVRMNTRDIFSGGLFIIDLQVMPFGCGVWPAFWTLGYEGSWPDNGEIDILEGIMSNNNKHTTAGCQLDQSPGLFTGTVGNTNCDSSSGGTGCSIISDSTSSYGQPFNNDGGGVFAMKWDGSGISIWNWNRWDIPQDITNQNPDPTTWGLPAAEFSGNSCDMGRYFQAQVLILNIDLCGDWAGGVYSTYSYCPGTCADFIANPSNLDTAVMLINYIRVYQQGATSPVSAQADKTNNLTGAGGAVAGPSSAHPSLRLSLIPLIIASFSFLLSMAFLA